MWRSWNALRTDLLPLAATGPALHAFTPGQHNIFGPGPLLPEGKERKRKWLRANIVNPSRTAFMVIVSTPRPGPVILAY